MADNKSFRDGDGNLYTHALDELSGSVYSNKVTVLAGDGTATAIDPRALTHLPGEEYEYVAASATNQVLGTTGASGDLLNKVWIFPATTSPGSVVLKDGSTSPDVGMTLFPGGASSVSNLVPFVVDLGALSASGAWSITTGTNVSVIATGLFT